MDTKKLFQITEAAHACGISRSTLLRMELLKLPQVNEVVITEDRLLHFYPYGSWEDADPVQQSAETAQSLAALQAHVEENGGRFYFVGLPNQLSYFQECYPDYLDRAKDYLPALHRAFPEALARKGVNFIDLVTAFEAAGKPAEYYTETDHHYSLKGAMVSYRAIVKRLQADGLDIPLLEEVLPLFVGRAPLIVELKAERGNAAALAAATCAVLDKYKVDCCVESFDPRCLMWLWQNRPDVIRGQLSENFTAHGDAQHLPGGVRWILTNLLLNVRTRPDFIAYRFSDRDNLSLRLCRSLYGVQEASWTIRSKADMDAAEAAGSLVIFENFDPRG